MLADVTGHGVSAALYTMTLKGLIENHSNLAGSPGEFITAVSQDLAPFLIPGGFASAFYAVVDGAQNQVTYTSAGHPPALLFRARDGKVERLALEGMVLGVLPDFAYNSSSVELAPGDLLLCYTDGVTEVCDAEEKMLRVDGLARLLSEEARNEQADILDRLYQRVRDYCCEVALPDDVLLLSVSRVG